MYTYVHMYVLTSVPEVHAALPVVKACAVLVQLTFAQYSVTNVYILYILSVCMCVCTYVHTYTQCTHSYVCTYRHSYVYLCMY